MKVRPIRPGKSYVLDIFRAIAQNQDFKLTDPASTDEFLKSISDDLSKALTNPITIYGISAQTMFEYVAASLGKCQLVKSEDAGALHSDNPDIKVPDFRLLLQDEGQLLVEAKNFYQKSPFQPFRMKPEYLNGLIKYANLFKADVRIAVYWTRWTTWTLVSPEAFVVTSKGCILGLEDALKATEMARLGDVHLATIPPLKFRILSDPTSDRTIDPSGQVQFRIGGIELYCGTTRIDEPLEQSIALFIMLYGSWPSELGVAITEGDQLIAFDIVSQPDEPAEEQPFSLIGSMSSMVSRRFLSMTTSSGHVQRLAPKSLESDLGIRIPDNYKGKALPLWRFILVSSEYDPVPADDHNKAA